MKSGSRREGPAAVVGFESGQWLLMIRTFCIASAIHPADFVVIVSRDRADHNRRRTASPQPRQAPAIRDRHHDRDIVRARHVGDRPGSVFSENRLSPPALSRTLERRMLPNLDKGGS